MTCRICLEEGEFVHPCRCKGDVGNVHAECLLKWVQESRKDTCEICNSKYNTKDIPSWNPDRAIYHFFSCKTSPETDHLFKKFGGTIFATSCLSLIFMDVDHLVVASCVSSLLISIIIVGYAIHAYGNDIGLYNAAFMWKLAFSIPYMISVLIFYIQLQDLCDVNCMSVHHICDETCPVYSTYEQKNKYLMTLWLYDLYLLAATFLLRFVMICYFHMRRLKFHDLEEEEPLLSGSDDDAESTGSTGSTGSPFGSSGTTTGMGSSTV